MPSSKANQTRSLPTLIEDLGAAHEQLSEHEDHVAADSGTLAALEASVATIERISEAAEQAYNDEVESEDEDESDDE